MAALSALFLHLVTCRGGTPIWIFNESEGGVWIDEAQRVVDGEIMYRDFFEFLMPGIVHLNAAILRLFGPRIEPLVHAVIALGALLTVLIHALAGRAVGGGWRRVAPLLFATLAYAPLSAGNHKAPALLFGLSCLLALARRRASPARCALGGVLAGASSLFTQDIGFGLALGVTAHLLATDGPRARLLAPFWLGWGSVVCATLGGFASVAGLRTVLYDCVVFPFAQYTRTNPFRLGPFSTEPEDLPRAAAQAGLVLGGLASGVGILWPRRGAAAPRGPADDPLRLTACAGLGVLAATTLQRGIEPRDLAFRAAILIVPLVALLESSWARRGRARALAAGFSALLGLGALYAALGMVASRQLGPMTLEAHRAGSVWMMRPAPEALWIGERAAPGERVFLLPVKGGLYFLSRTRSASSLQTLQAIHSEEQRRQLLREIAEQRPSVGAWDGRYGPPLKPVLDPVYASLRNEYAVERILGNGVTLLRKAPPRDEGDR